MAHDTVEIFVRGLTEAEAAHWLSTVFDAFERERGEPIVTYEGRYSGTTVPVQITEHVENGPFTSVWFNAAEGPWDSTKDCARAAHEALGAEVLCYPGPGRLTTESDEEMSGKPWAVFRVAEGDEGFVDERQLHH